MKKKLLSLTLALCLGLTFPAFAAEEAPIPAEEGVKNIAVTAKIGDLTFDDLAVDKPWTKQGEDDTVPGYYAVTRDTEFTVGHTGAADDGTVLYLYLLEYEPADDGVYGAVQRAGNVYLNVDRAFDPEAFQDEAQILTLRAGESASFTLPFDWYDSQGGDVIFKLYAAMSFPKYDWTFWKTFYFKEDGAAYQAAVDRGPSNPGLVAPPVIPSFSDVKETDWFRPYVEKAVAAGLMTGVSEDLFSPGRELSLAETLVLAYQLHSRTGGGSVPQIGGAWYMPYYQYCLNSGIIAPNQLTPSGLTGLASRFEMAAILDKAVPASRMIPVKEIASIPDLAEGDPYGAVVYKWYRAGIVGGDEFGRFNGGSSVTRAEMAVILCQLNNL